ncbi:MAG: pyrroline-5-carboxylate reductase [Clostridiales bacterium]|jgi:pyrroline-5-carboxylate reductase|nr:pyrroline-5-carboxylate reductase [Clostridiales bacterium]HOB64677.1 pyrroline-5-carboxylate reductase [Clostridia bacterium]HOK81480.1 pyrroline-5-carboxylate reductase [Clostridia bacterium]HOL60780.1 pyrroline-5-carboxylate reductase [Clostridia bacterium]HPO53355.1 pyrroline-5-carboxylate reductase [Clostridia bacterium]
MSFKLGFLGAGVMAGAILDNVLINAGKLGVKPEDIAVYDIDGGKVAAYAQKGVYGAKSAGELFEECEIVLLGVKPQYYREILDGVTDYKCSAVVSIMAGVKIATLKGAIGKDIGIVRVMPNTPCRIGEGMSAVCFYNVDAVTADFIKGVFSCCGKVIEISEDKFDAVTSISGSGPAYVYMFADGLIKGGMDGGLTPEESRILALQTLIGAAKLAAADEIPLDILVDRVCSKGGTTIEAVDFFRQSSLPEIIKEGVKRCRDKSKLLSEKL